MQCCLCVCVCVSVCWCKLVSLESLDFKSTFYYGFSSVALIFSHLLSATQYWMIMMIDSGDDEDDENDYGDQSCGVGVGSRKVFSEWSRSRKKRMPESESDWEPGVGVRISFNRLRR